jgi:hypothetical protein
MGFQFLNLFSGQSASVSHLAVAFHVPNRTHSHNDRGYGRVAQDITQRRFSHLIQSDIQIGSKVLHAFVDLLLAITPEVSAAEITRFKRGVRVDFSSQSSFVECHPYDYAHLVTFTDRKQLIFRALLENIIDDLNGIYYAGLN